jgi:hypothetical protein
MVDPARLVFDRCVVRSIRRIGRSARGIDDPFDEAPESASRIGEARSKSSCLRNPARSA